MSLIKYDRENKTLSFCCNALLEACFREKLLSVLYLTRLDSDPVLTLGETPLRRCPFCGHAEFTKG